MKFTYENQGHNTFLVYELSDFEDIDSLSLGMLTTNNIPSLIKATFVQMDLKRYIKYNISSKISAKQLFMGSVNKKRLLSVFSGIMNAMLSAEEYMLNTDMIVLDMDYIFTDVSSNETVMICLPVMCSEYKQNSIGMFLKNIMFSTQFDQSENCDYVAKIINHLNSVSVFSLETFKDLLDSLQEDMYSFVTKSNELINSTVVDKKSSTFNQQNAIPNVYTNIHKSQPTVEHSSIVSPSTLSGNLFDKTIDEDKKRVQPSINAAVVNKPLAPVNENESLEHSDEKSISLLYLLQHFNSKNFQTYRNQKSSQKSRKNVSTAATEKVSAFAIPGQSTTPMQSNNKSFISQIDIDVTNQKSDHSVSSFAGNQSLSGSSIINNLKSNPNTSSKSNSAMNMGESYTSNIFSNSGGNFGETTVLSYSNIGETTVLGVAQFSEKKEPYLIRVKYNEKIPINENIFRIGKERSYVNYFIGDNTAISRSHANIITRNNKYYVVDTNSTNHTYVNGEMIPSNSEIEIEDGTKIRFANEEFEFKIS